MIQMNENYRYEPFANETFRHMPSADGVSAMVASNYLLGDVSGKIEWTQQPDKARNTFIHLSAYEHFIDEQQLLLLGRTGSGKSAIIYGLKDDIQNGIVDNYSDVIQLDEKEFCEKLAEICYGIDIDRFDATNKIMSAVVMAICTKVMLYCCENFKDDRNKLRYTTKYLLSNNFITVKAKNLSDILAQLSSDDYEQHIKTLYDSNVISTTFGIARLLLKTHEIIAADDDIAGNIDDYKKALNELTAFLASNRKKVLVLLDSFDEYKINDKAFVIATKALILAFKFFAIQYRIVYFSRWH